MKRAITFEFSFLQEIARITLARTNALVIQDTVDSIARLTLMTVNLHHAYTASKVSLSFSPRTRTNSKRGSCGKLKLKYRHPKGEP